MQKKVFKKVAVLCLSTVLLLGNAVPVLADDSCHHTSTTSYTTTRKETRACSEHVNCTLSVVYADTRVVCTQCGKQLDLQVVKKQEIHNYH